MLIDPVPPMNILVAEVAEVGDGAPKAGEPQPSGDRQHLPYRAGRNFSGGRLRFHGDRCGWIQHASPSATCCYRPTPAGRAPILPRWPLARRQRLVQAITPPRREQQEGGQAQPQDGCSPKLGEESRKRIAQTTNAGI